MISSGHALGSGNGLSSSDTQTLVQCCITLCRHIAVDCRDGASLLKSIVANIKTIDKRSVYRGLFPGDPYIDWNYVASIDKCVFGGVSAVLRLLNFVSFPDADVAYAKACVSEREHGASVRYVRAFVGALQSNSLGMPLNDALRLLLLYNLAHINGTAALELFCTSKFQRATEDNVLKLIAALAQQYFSPDDYNASITWVLQQARVDPVYTKEIERVLAERESLHQILRVKDISINTGRPRLLDRLAAKRGHRDEQARVVSASKGGGMALNGMALNGMALNAATGNTLAGECIDTFDGWCTRVRFPTTISSTLKQRLYVVMSQQEQHVNYEDVVPRFTAPQVCSSVIKQRIARPDERVIANVIEQLDMRMAPFPELTHFMRNCFRSFPQTNMRELTLLKYMQLYIAAYQHPDLWKECWRQVYPLLSYQVIRDVEDFVKNTPFNQEAFIQIISTE